MACVQILIIEFGGTAFSTASLDIDHWIWCVLFGAGELLWGQVGPSISPRSSFLALYTVWLGAWVDSVLDSGAVGPRF